MAHPKHRHSKSRTRKRRNYKRLKVKPYYIDPESGQATLRHRVCLASGYYRGKKVMRGELEELE